MNTSFCISNIWSPLWGTFHSLHTDGSPEVILYYLALDQTYVKFCNKGRISHSFYLGEKSQFTSYLNLSNSTSYTYFLNTQLLFLKSRKYEEATMLIENRGIYMILLLTLFMNWMKKTFLNIWTMWPISFRFFMN